jgi:DNA-binding MarR family transcriptional regulator
MGLLERPDHRCTPRDSVDALTASWHERRPELDFSPVAVIARLGRVRSYVDAELDAVFARHGLGAATFGVLVTLARVDDGGGVSQRRLMEELGLTSGTVSVRMDRLVEEGLVDRRTDPESRRSTLISLTPAGRALFERVVPAHLANEERLLAALDAEERELLAALLRKLLAEFEGSRRGPEAAPALGLTLAAAHAAIELREAVGLPPVPGLLVRAVAADGAAARAGLRVGDVLLAAGDRELRSAGALHAAVAEGAAAGTLALRVLRGTGELTVAVALDAAGAREPARRARAEHRV